MRVLIEIGHPAHVHFFARCIRALRAENHHVVVVTRDKEITNQLLDAEKIPYRCLSVPRQGKWLLAFELLSRWFQIFEIILKEKIDLAVSISGISTSFPAWFSGIKSLTFTDTEDANITNVVAFPFSSKVVTPRFFLKSLGKKHLRYDGLHELAYLQGFDEKNAEKVRSALGFTEKYSIVRLVSNDALHDHDSKNLTPIELKRLIDTLSRSGKVFISSQTPLTGEFAQYQLQIPITDIHAILQGATCFVGDSPTMAVESALLGTPAYLVSPRVQRLGNMVHLEKDHRLLNCYLGWDAFWKDFAKIPDSAQLKVDWQRRAQLFSSTCAQMPEFVTQTILQT